MTSRARFRVRFRTEGARQSRTAPSPNRNPNAKCGSRHGTPTEGDVPLPTSFLVKLSLIQNARPPPAEAVSLMVSVPDCVTSRFPRGSLDDIEQSSAQAPPAQHSTMAVMDGRRWAG